MSEEIWPIVRKTFPELLRKLAPHLTEAEVQEIDQKVRTGKWDLEQLSPLIRFIWELNVELIKFERKEQANFEHKKELLEIRYRREIEQAREKYEAKLQQLINERKERKFEEVEKESKSEQHRYEDLHELKGKNFSEALQLMTSTLTEEEIREYDRKIQMPGTDIRQFPPGIQHIWQMFCQEIEEEEKFLISSVYQKQLLDLEYMLEKEHVEREYDQALKQKQQEIELEKKQIEQQRKREFIQWIILMGLVIINIYLLIRVT